MKDDLGLANPRPYSHSVGKPITVNLRQTLNLKCILARSKLQMPRPFHLLRSSFVTVAVAFAEFRLPVLQM